MISVRDNGVGFDMSQPRLTRHGLIGMRYRVESDGGTMRLESSPGQGTLIEATLPPAPAGAEPGDGIDDVAGGRRSLNTLSAVGGVLPGRGGSPDTGARAAPMLRPRQRTHTGALVVLPACGHEKRNPPPTSMKETRWTPWATPPE